MSDPTTPSDMIEMPGLEEPDAVARAGGGMQTLFPDDSMVVAIAKVTALESFLGLVTRDLKFADFMRELLMVVMGVVKSEAGSILEHDRKNRCFFFRAVVGQSSDRVNHFVIPEGQGIVGHVAESKQPLVVNNLEENQMHLRAIGKAVGFDTRNMIAVPIVIRGQTFGVLELLNRIGEDNYTPQDIELLTYVCNAAAKAIELRLMLAWAVQGQKSKAA